MPFCQRPCLAVQKSTFYRLKGHLLQSERRPFAAPFATSCKSACCRRKDDNTKNAAAYQRTSAVSACRHGRRQAIRIGNFPTKVREKPFGMRRIICYFAAGNRTKKIVIMKRIATIITVLATITAAASAMSYEQARDQALFLTDKMAYELNLTEEQYDAAYEVNLDYLMSINTPDDLYEAYWRQRNLDLSYILLDWQYRAFCAATYFYRPLYWTAGVWHFAVYSRYPHRHYYYFGRPQIYITYRGGHSWHHNGGHSWYKGRTFHHGAASKGHGLRDRFDRGDFHKKDLGGNRRQPQRGGNFSGHRGGKAVNTSSGRPQSGRYDKKQPSASFKGHRFQPRNNRESSTRKTVKPSSTSRRHLNQNSLKRPSTTGTARKPNATFTPKRSTSRPAVRTNSRPTRTTGSISRPSSSRGSTAKSSGRSGGGHFGGRR